MRIWIEVGIAIVIAVLGMGAMAWGLHYANELVTRRCVQEAFETACYVGGLAIVAVPFAACAIYIWAVRRCI